MVKLIAIVAALGLLVVSAPAFAQKPSCENFCLKNCASAASKSWCMQKCTANCNMNRSK
jgi:hypothetical protein